MWSKKNKDKEEKIVYKTQFATSSQTSIVRTVEKTTRSVSVSGTSYSGIGSLPSGFSSSSTFGNNNFLLPPTNPPEKSMSTSNLGNRVYTDAKPVNLNYQSPYRNSPAYGSFQASKKTPTTSTTTTTLYQGTNRNSPAYSSFQPPTIKTTETVYRQPLPATVKPLPSEPISKKIVVKKTGKFYDKQCAIPTYQTHSKNRGEVLIINNIMFKDKGERKGAKLDDKNLESLFKQMGFKVNVLRDRKSTEMVSEVKKFSQKSSLKSADIAIVVAMSHGTKNETLGGTEIFGLDEKGVLINDLVEYFNEINCKYMANKPKIFIFQCCRGDNELFIQKDAVREPARVPALINGLIAYSTLPGFTSHRDPDTGTWYIKTLCDVFSQHAHEYHIEDLLKMVDVKLSAISKTTRQITHYENRGFKRCYLHPI